MWILIFIHAATVQIMQPNWLALTSLVIIVLIDVTVWVVMIDAMYRIWKLGNDLSGTFPNQKMLTLLVGSYTLYFIGQIVIFGSIVYFEVQCGDIPVNSENLQTRLAPQKIF